MHEVLWTCLESPLGPVHLVAADGELRGVYLPEQRWQPRGRERDDDPILRLAGAQLREYFAGARRRFDLPLGPQGTQFQRAVWSALAEIGFGETRSYGELARALGRPTAARAVGAANGHNPLSIVVPCHRVVGSDRRLVGYAGGLACKQWLLAHEARLVRPHAGG